MNYAIRFLPADPARRDEPAMYLSTARIRSDVCRVTSVENDVYEIESAGRAELAVRAETSVKARCRRDNLIADVVPFADALADCRDIEPRP